MIPKLKYNELLDYINEIVTGNAPMEHLSEIKSQAIKLESTSYKQSKVLLGTIAALQGDSKEVDKQFNAAIRHTGGDPVVRLNYARALDNTNRNIAALDILEKLHNDFPDDKAIIEVLYNANMRAANIPGAIKANDQAIKLGFASLISKEDLGLIKYTPKVLEIHGITWRDVSERIENVTGVIRSSGFDTKKAAQFTDEDTIFLEFHIMGDAESANKAEQAVHNYLSTLDYQPIDDALTVGCIPA